MISITCQNTSLKFQLIATDLERIENDVDERLAHGVIERIGGAAIVTLNAEGKNPVRSAEPVKDVRAAVELVVRWIASENAGIENINSLADIHAVGHRVVHGGEKFKQSAFIDTRF